MRGREQIWIGMDRNDDWNRGCLSWFRNIKQDRRLPRGQSVE